MSPPIIIIIIIISQVTDRSTKQSKKPQVDHHDSLFIGFFTVIFVLKV